MKINLIAPAKYLEINSLNQAKTRLEKSGFTVNTGKYIACQDYYFSASDDKRLADLQQALDDETADFILCACGGYGTIRLMKKLDFTKFSKRPKWLMGFSDITILHNQMRILGIPSVHCTMPLMFTTNTAEAFETMLNVMYNRHNRYEFAYFPLNRIGQVKAPVVGGNLSILSSLIGTPLELKTEGCILFIEDIGEAIYAIERMFWQLKLAGTLSVLKGLIIGNMTNIKDTIIPYGKTVEEVISNIIKEYDFPVCYHFPAGHTNDNRAIILGKEATLLVNEQKTIFIQ